jgi:hypothetical protein
MTVARPAIHVLNPLSYPQVEFSARVTRALDIKEAIKIVHTLPALGFCPAAFKKYNRLEDSDENQPKDDGFDVRNEANEV